jgi:hypothetical protein
VASTDKDFNNKKALVGARLFYVSNISFVNNIDAFFVLNRDNGQPLAVPPYRYGNRNTSTKHPNTSKKNQSCIRQTPMDISERISKKKVTTTVTPITHTCLTSVISMTGCL